MHRNAKRAMLFTTGKLRSIRRRANLRRMMRQEVAVDVHHLRRTRKPHQQQTGSSQHPQPQGVRGCISSALESFRQEVQVSVAAQNSRATNSMTHSTGKWSHHPTSTRLTLRNSAPSANSASKPSPYPAFNAFVNAGTISNKSPTTPTSAISKIGAASSLLIAITVFAPFIPTKC